MRKSNEMRLIIYYIENWNRIINLYTNMQTESVQKKEISDNPNKKKENKSDKPKNDSIKNKKSDKEKVHKTIDDFFKNINKKTSEREVVIPIITDENTPNDKDHKPTSKYIIYNIVHLFDISSSDDIYLSLYEKSNYL